MYVAMAWSKFIPEQKGHVVRFLALNYSIRLIIKECKKLGFKISMGSIRNIQKEFKNWGQPIRPKKPRPPIKRHLRNGSRTDLKRLRMMASKPNPVPQTEMERRLGVSESTIRYCLKKLSNLSESRRSQSTFWLKSKKESGESAQKGWKGKAKGRFQL